MAVIDRVIVLLVRVLLLDYIAENLSLGIRNVATVLILVRFVLIVTDLEVRDMLTRNTIEEDLLPVLTGVFIRVVLETLLFGYGTGTVPDRFGPGSVIFPEVLTNLVFRSEVADTVTAPQIFPEVRLEADIVVEVCTLVPWLATTGTVFCTLLVRFNLSGFLRDNVF